MNLARWLTSPRKQRGRPGARQSPLSLDQWGDYFTYGGLQYPALPGFTNTLGQKHEEPPQTFDGLVQYAYKQNGIVWSVMVARMLIFSEARFQFQDMKNGRPGELFGTQDLAILETPWPKGTTGQMLARMIQDVDLGGNAFLVRQDGPSLRRMRPDWVTIVAGSKKRTADGRPTPSPRIQLDAEVIGYIYHPGGRGSGEPPEPLLPEQVAHWAPYPDPAAEWRGTSWLEPVLTEVAGDKAATQHKLAFFENGAVPGLVVSLDPNITPEDFQKWVEIFEDEHRGYLRAYETLFLGGGANVTAVGGNLEQIDFVNVQGLDELRICAAGGMPPMLVGVSKGLEASTYANYQWAIRRAANFTLRPLWRTLCEVLDSMVPHRAASRLWYDTRDIAALAEDIKDKAVVMREHSIAANLLIEAGYEPDAVTDAIVADDFALLRGNHTGLTSVQLQKPGTDTGGAKNGKPNAEGAPNVPPPKNKVIPPRSALTAIPKTTGSNDEGD